MFVNIRPTLIVPHNTAVPTRSVILILHAVQEEEEETKHLPVPSHVQLRKTVIRVPILFYSQQEPCLLNHNNIMMSIILDRKVLRSFNHRTIVALCHTY